MVAVEKTARVAGHEIAQKPLPEGTGGILRAQMQLTTNKVMPRFGTRPLRSQIIKTVSNILKLDQSIWRPAAVYRWYELSQGRGEALRIATGSKGRGTALTVGSASPYFESAQTLMVGLYTVGKEFEEQAEKASAEQGAFVGYLYDMIGLAVLDVLADAVGLVAEEYAAAKGWGVSPLLGPGSVQGFEVDQQATLCSLLPLEMINVEVGDNGVLKPFRSVSFVIGVGAGYHAKKVANGCEVCLRKNNCTMHRPP